MAALGAADAVRRLSQEEVDAICARHERLWAARPGGARAVFAWTDLSGLDLSGRNLCDADFTGATLAGCDFTRSRLDNANFFGADLQDCMIVEASLRRADLRGVCLRGADLTAADLFECDLREGSIATIDPEKGFTIRTHAVRASEARGAVLCGANLERSKMSGIIAVKADFSDAILKDAKLVRANLKQANMTGCDMAGADLSGADLSGADLKDAILVGATLVSVRLDDVDMSCELTDAPKGADVEALPYADMLREHALWCETDGANGAPSCFDKADLRRLGSIKRYNLTALSAKGAVFYGLDMEGVQLQGAHLEEADLRGCNLRRADLRGARLARAKLAGADLRDAQLGPLLIATERILPSDLTQASLKGADCSGADFRQAMMAGADLSRADFSRALLKQADITGAELRGARGLQDAF